MMTSSACMHVCVHDHVAKLNPINDQANCSTHEFPFDRKKKCSTHVSCMHVYILFHTHTNKLNEKRAIKYEEIEEIILENEKRILQ